VREPISFYPWCRRHHQGALETEYRVNDKTIEILIQLLGHIKENNLDVESLNEFSERLVNRGYNEREVAEALGWLFDRFSMPALQSSDAAAPAGGAVRVLHDYERTKITPDVYGHLLKLQSLGALNGPRMEKVIDYCMLFGTDGITESDIDELVASFLFEER
jgi:uncharacterized protein Smg (DUF494 family)